MKKHQTFPTPDSLFFLFYNYYSWWLVFTVYSPLSLQFVQVVYYK